MGKLAAKDGWTKLLPPLIGKRRKAHELIAWIQEEALARLAEGGSRHLAKLSQNRYALRLGSGPEVTAARAEQDFFVVDAWNGDSGDRMVGIVTHVRELAERVPARLEVCRAGNTAIVCTV